MDTLGVVKDAALAGLVGKFRGEKIAKFLTEDDDSLIENEYVLSKNKIDSEFEKIFAQQNVFGEENLTRVKLGM